MDIPFRTIKWLTRKKYSFHKVNLSKNILNAYHALTVDEFRRQFEPTLWKKNNISNGQNVEQRWFAGSHSNIGGGFGDEGLSNTTFHWMLEKLQRCIPGIDIDNKYVSGLEKNECGEFRGDFSWLYFGSKLKKYIKATDDPEIANQVIDDSVYKRMVCGNFDYKPKNVKAK